MRCGRVRALELSTHPGAIGAVVARFVHTEEVTGSNPVSPTNEKASDSSEKLKSGVFLFRGPCYLRATSYPSYIGGKYEIRFTNTRNHIRHDARHSHKLM